MNLNPNLNFNHRTPQDAAAAKGVKLSTLNNDTGEETTYPLLRTGYLHWGVNNLGYTITAMYLSETSDLPSGAFRLMVFSDARLTPLTKVGRGAGGYGTGDRVMRLEADFWST